MKNKIVPILAVLFMATVMVTTPGSVDGGATFGPTINLSNNPRLSLNPEIAISGTNVYVVWHDHESPTNAEIFYKRSTDSGASFVEPTKNLSESPEVSERPAIAAIAAVYMLYGKKIHLQIEILHS